MNIIPFKAVGLVALGAFLAYLSLFLTDAIHTKKYLDQVASVAVLVRSPFVYTFNESGIVEETGNMYESESPYWWLDSGGFMTISSNIGQTIQGDLPYTNKWYQEYARSSSIDTDGGLHPQNLFRLITRSTWKNLRQEAYFMITRDNISSSPNRNESNGLLLFNRYRDSDNLYYAGLRVDGTAVIKKKLAGTYYTLDQESVFKGKPYDRESSPSLLPKGLWIGIRTEVTTDASKKVYIKLYVDIGKNGTWKMVAEAVDDGVSSGSIINNKAYAGIRTDFMDVNISNYKIEEL